MTAPARLTGLRLQGFKSFAERTVVEFGPGISAIVGPNGSGKSNLADALRWALGEQGRALRIRRSEDVIFAGSERRSALGMADVQLTLDNEDGLLPVAFDQVELGRRLYRSGENDYLLNRQRIRLRDLVDLLDAANLADNAFLFIGQGMVDQALALRPEERRPLFEEVAGVRRHERRRRRAEEQLAESEANLARVEDIVTELRPQVRRLAAQAEQQATRQSVGDELAAAVLLAAHGRWHEASRRATGATSARDRARASASEAMRALSEAETLVASIAGGLAARAAAETDRRAAHDAARDRLTDLRLRDARLAAELEAIGRDRERLAGERAAADAELAAARRSLTAPVPTRDHDAEAELASAERALADALAELAALRTADAVEGEQLAALRRAAGVREAELETARRRLAEAERRLAEETEAGLAVSERLAAHDTARATASRGLDAALDSEGRATAEREAARIAAETAEAQADASRTIAAAAAERLAAIRGRLEAIERRLADEEARGIARAARRRGGSRVDEGLEVEPAFRAAVHAVLGESGRAFRVARRVVGELGDERGSLVVEERLAELVSPTEREARIIERARMTGGGPLIDAILTDPIGAVRRLVDRVIWVPDAETALQVQPELPVGWLAVTRDGSVVVGPLEVRLGRPEETVDRRTEAQRVAAELERSAAEAEARSTAAAEAAAAADIARQAVRAAQAAEAQAVAARRLAEDEERTAARSLEAISREAVWHDAAVTRLAADVDRARRALAELEPSEAGREPVPVTSGVPTDRGRALAAWEARATELRARRDRLAGQVGELDAARREAEARRARAEADAATAASRLERLDREIATAVAIDATRRGERAAVAGDLAVAAARESEAREALAELVAADADDRGRLTEAEGRATAARDRLRVLDEAARAADVAELEARLGLDAIREAVLVELAGLGEPGRRGLAEAAGLGGVEPAVPGAARGSTGEAGATVESSEAVEAIPADDDTVADLESLLAAVAPRWAAAAPADAGPSPARLAALRRRYHELGAANPYAVEEHAELRTRLEGLETQAADLRVAIGRTRELIVELDALIADQFRTTFRALESAFDRRFGQLFGGGFARLTLTEPGDLAATGVEIVARPPGKKAQNLAMLSGGERALTAVALLFSMLEVRPVPFCVLDEVDAALDEANVGRFTEALRGLAEATQFIVITHNRGTIEQADALYGVTVGDDSVSRIISLRLDEAQAIADEATATSADGADRSDDAVLAG
jgi:chromosome segregation protein